MNFLDQLSNLPSISSAVQSDLQAAEQGATVAYTIIALELGVIAFLLFRILAALRK